MRNSDGRLVLNSLRGAMLAGASMAVLLPAQAAMAQQASATDGGNSTVQEVVVTAQKRSESAQNVPIAITALSAKDVLSAGVTDTQDLKAAVPALNVTTGVGGFGLPRIRGIGATGQGAGIENPVAVYVDGVYYGASFGVLQSLFDVEQVAVLKGPQGTLFGRNATGGLIQITTKGPSYNYGGRAQVGYGAFETTTGGLYVTGGLSKTVAVSLSGQYENRNKGYGKNLFTGHDIQDGRTMAARAKLLWDATDTTSVLLSIDGNSRDAAEPGIRNFDLNALGQNLNTQIRGLGGDLARDIYADVDPQLRQRQWGAAATVTHDFSGVQLKSITAYRKSRLRILFDPDGTTQPRLRIGNDYTDEQISQEFNLISTAAGPLQWVVGAYGLMDDASAVGHTTGTQTFGDNGYTDAIYSVGLSSIAGFAEATYSIAENTHLIGGLRYTKDDRDMALKTLAVNRGAGTTVLTPSPNDSRTFDKVTWRLSADHRFSPELMAYASFNRGFRAGTFVAAGSPVIVLQPEIVDAYEVGLKSDLFDRRVRINAAAYYYDQTHVQVVQVIAGIQNVYNADGAEVYGVDADLTWQVNQNLRLFGGLNYTHATYKSFPNAIISAPYPLPA